MEQTLPVFSIIIPTHDRPNKLAACLQALAHLDYPHDHFEVIVVDDGSKTPPESMVSALSDRLNIRLITQSQAGPATARNAGATRAKGKFLAFTDDDCIPAPDWLKTLAKRFATSPNCIIGGQILNALPKNLHATASQLLVDYLYGYFNVNPDQANFFTSNNLALPSDLFRAIGGFDTTFSLAAAEDREFCDRWLHLGLGMIYASEVQVYHTHALTFRTFLRQHFNYGRGAYRFRQIYARRNYQHIRLEPLSFYRDLLLDPFSKARKWSALLMILLIGSQVANAVGFGWEKLLQSRQTASNRDGRHQPLTMRYR